MAPRKRKTGSTERRQAAAHAPRRGRPTVHAESWAKVGMVLLTRHVLFLDRLCLEIRAQSGRPITRSDAVRGIIEGVAASGLDLTRAATEEEIAHLVSARLRR